MDEFIQSVSAMWQKFSTDPTSQTHALLGGILLAVGWVAFRRKPRSKVNIDCPHGEKVFVQIGDDDEDAKK